MNLHRAALLDKPSLLPGYCVVCGGPATNKHHAIPGDRKNKRIPLLHLCGSGCSGCHGDAHAMRLHFRFTDRWEYLRTPPMKYDAALELDGWRSCR